MIVEALYPIVGRLVTASVANAFRELVETLNDRIDALVSANSWRLRMKAMATGKSIAEVALAEAEAGRLRRAMLLERGSGRVLSVWPMQEQGAENAELESGMIAAITEFASSVYADKGGELRSLDLGASHVFLRASPRVIIAAEFGGEVSRQREAKLDDAFLSIIERHERDEASCAPEAIGSLLNEAVEEPAKPKSKTPVIVFGLVVAGLLGWAAYGPITRAWHESLVREAFQNAMAGHERLVEYPLRVDVDHDGQRVVLRGLAANETQPQAIVETLAPVAKPYRVEKEVSIVALASQAEEMRAGEARAVATLQEAQKQIEILNAEVNRLTTLYDSPRAKLQRHISSFAVFFAEQDNLLDAAAANKGLDELADLLKSSDVNLRVVGYADEVGSANLNRSISRRRADKIVNMLVERGVPRQRLALVPRAAFDPISDVTLDAVRSRRVVFELPFVGEFDLR
jgi:outer membrane protein OmpA-like peptidoglycan-associated protein